MRIIVVIFLTALMPMLSMGQSSLGKTDDLGRIAIAAVVPDEAGIPAGAQRMLQNRLNQVATLNGLGATPGSQFAILPMVSIISQDVTPTAPPMIALNVEITLYIVDAKSQTIFSQTTIPLKGVGKTEDRAYTQAINNIKPRHGQFRGFVEKGKEKIVEYYNSQCDVIISSAKALAGQKKYDEALYTLMSVPDVSRECHDKCLAISVDIYQEYADQQCNQYLSAAKAAWAGKELSKVEENLGKITPDMGCFPEAEQLLAQITSAVEVEGGTAWSFKMKKYEDSVDIEKMKIQAGKEVAQSWAYHGASANFDWAWLYPGSAKPAPQAEKVTDQSPEQTRTEESKPESANKSGVLPATVSHYEGPFKGNFHLLTDGMFAKNGTKWDGELCVAWSGSTSFTLDLGAVYNVTGITVSVDNNDSYKIDWSEDGSSFHKLTLIDESFGKVGWGMDMFSTITNHNAFEPRIAFQPVKARYIKIYAVGGDDNYSVSELQIFGF